jgi:hypothetical protein
LLVSKSNKFFIAKNTTVAPLIQKMDVLFFKPKQESTPELREYLAFLASIKIKRPYRFAFIDSEGSLINTMTLRENIHLDSVPTKLSITKEHELSHLLKRLGNNALLELFNRIDSWDVVSSKVNDRERKIAALLKGLLQEAEYIFLNNPEKYLNEEELNLFKKALEFQMSTFGQIAFISSPDYGAWEPFCSKLVSRGQGQQFQITAKTHSLLGQAFLAPLEQTLDALEEASDEGQGTKEGHLFFYSELKKAS